MPLPARYLRHLIGLLTVAVAALAVWPGVAISTDDRLETLDPAGVRGTLFLCGGGRLPDAVRDAFVEAAGGKSGRLVVIPTASPGEDSEALQDGAEVADLWRARGLESVVVLHTRDKGVANDPAFCEPLRTATAVWFTGGRQTQIAAAYTGTLVEQEVAALLERGGVVGGTSAGAACVSRIMIVRGRVYETPGLGLFPGAIVDQHFLARNRRDRLLDVLRMHPNLVGVGIDEGTALVVHGRELKCLGDSTVHLCLGLCGPHEPCERILKPGETSDLTMFRRGALCRLEAPFPPAEPRAPVVEQGSLVIVGGGGLTKEIVERFIELAGGPDAPIVVLPTANPLPDPNEGKFLESAGATNVRSLTARGRAEIETPEVLDALRQARGIWFGGGRQWRFVDAYEGTAAMELFRDVLRRGGVIGGSSAGATIQGDYLVRGSPLGNTDMMALGYERGFAFLPGTAIDQHFSQRNRFADLSRVVDVHPQLLGIGLDEATAIVVRGSVAEVLGKHSVHFFDRSRARRPGEPDYESVAAGGRYDLKRRELLRGTESPLESAGSGR